jgi:hypothetical protein
MSRPGGKDANQRELLVKFKVEKFLGKGSYGSVFAVKRLSDNQTYALKVRMGDCTGNGCEDVFKQVRPSHLMPVTATNDPPDFA